MIRVGQEKRKQALLNICPKIERGKETFKFPSRWSTPLKAPGGVWVSG